jgi:hypothetical protein
MFNELLLKFKHKKNVGRLKRVKWFVKKTTATKSIIYHLPFLCALVTEDYMQKQGLIGQTAS